MGVHWSNEGVNLVRCAASFDLQTCPPIPCAFLSD